MTMMIFLSLFIYSCFTANILLQSALGIKGTAESKNPLGTMSVINYIIIFFSCILMWVLFSKIISSFISGIFIYVLLFPVSYIAHDSFQFLIFRYFIKKDIKNDGFIDFPGGITAFSAFVCLNLANNFLQAAVLSFGFTAGILFVNLIILEIKKRAVLEKVPVYLRGKPLVLITMGLLSLVFTAVSALLFRVIGVK